MYYQEKGHARCGRKTSNGILHRRLGVNVSVNISVIAWLTVL